MPRRRHANLLSRLFTLRWVETGCQLLVLGGAQRWLALEQGPVAAMAAIILAQAAFNALCWWRLRRPWPVTDLELFGHVAVDLVALGGLLYFGGGSANPFVSLLLLPLTIAAAILPPAYAGAMAALAVAGYTLLMFFSVPLPPQRVDLAWLQSLMGATAGTAPEPAAPMDHSAHMGHSMPAAQDAPATSVDSGFALHLLGMWFNFVVSAGIIAFFLARLAATLRERDRELVTAREEALRNEQILALGTLAAGAAHQLGTPLSTMAVVIRELELDHGDDAELCNDLGLLRRQVDNCKGLISQLLNAAGRPRGESGAALPVDRMLAELVDKWRLLRPQTQLATRWDGEQPPPRILAEPTLEQALLNLLDNAADASPSEVALEAHWDKHGCVIEILDRGPGLAGSVAQKIGQPFFTTKSEKGGLGIGLFLSNATLERFGGKVELFNRDDGGARTRITLPFGRLQT